MLWWFRYRFCLGVMEILMIDAGGVEIGRNRVVAHGGYGVWKQFTKWIKFINFRVESEIELGGSGQDRTLSSCV